MAKRRTDKGGELPSFAQLTGAEPEPGPEPGPVPPGPGARPGIPPARDPGMRRPTKVKAGEMKASARTDPRRKRAKGKDEPELDEKGLPKRKRNRVVAAIIKGSRAVKQRMMMAVPEDPIEKMRFKLKWLGFLKFPISFIMIAAVAILLTLVLWFYIFDYEATFMLYSRSVSVLYLLIPACIGMFSLIYFGMNLTLINRKERRMTELLEAMLEEEAEAKEALRAKGKKKEKKVEEEAGPEEKEEKGPSGPSRQGLNITS